MIKGGKRLFPKQKATRLLITKNILEKITENEPVDHDKLNIDTMFKVAWISFLRLGKITYSSTKLKKTLFSDTKVIKSDVLFFERN